MAEPIITTKLFAFLRDLAKNNNRDWFNANKDRYVEHVKKPVTALIEALEGPMLKVSRHLVVDPSPVGGSMFRIYRDVRFSPDKRPYKTHASAQFRHESGKDVHAPGLYLHLEPGGCFAGGGLYRPDSKALKAVRAKLDTDGKGWKKAIGGKKFIESFELGGESLKRAPQDYAIDHPLIEDLKRKDFVATTPLSQKQITDPQFPKILIERYRVMVPFMSFLTDAVGVPF